MPEGTRDPENLTAAHFYLALHLKGSKEPVDAIFMECQGFKTTQEVIEVCEVTPQQWGKANQPGYMIRTKVPGNVKTNNLVLRRGLNSSITLWNWFKAIQQGNWAEKDSQQRERRDGYLVIYDQAGKMQARFDFKRAWPTSYKVSDVSAKSNDFELEELELAVEEFTRDTDIKP